MYELTIFEYEDTQVLGQFETRDQALIALGQYVLEHGDVQFPHPHITKI